MIGRHVFITRQIPDRGLELLRDGGCEVQIGQPDGDAPIAPEAVREGVAKADALVCLLTEPIDRETMQSGTNLLGIANYAVGYNNIDIDAATELGLPVTNTPDVLTETTADLTWALLLATARRIPEGHRLTAEGRFKIWNAMLLLGQDVGPGGSGRRKTLGIVGFGRIGRAVARRASGFDMRVLAHNPRNRAEIEGAAGVDYAELDDLLRESDFVSLHAPLNDETRHLIGKRELGLMKPTACLINAARGPIVDERALVDALASGKIAGAGLDVYEHEPELTAGLADLANVVLAPHIGSATLETRSEMAAIAARNTLAHLRAERAPHVVNPEVYEREAWRKRVGRADRR